VAQQWCIETRASYAAAYGNAAKQQKSQILDHVVAETGWSRDNARRQLTATANRLRRGAPAQPAQRKARTRKFSGQALQVLRFVWMVSGFQCGKYLVQSMRLHLDALEYHGELAFNRLHYSGQVRDELLAMSAASIDRYLKQFRDAGEAERTAPVLRSSISISDLGTLFDPEPGFVECDLFGHGTSAMNTARTLNLTCVHTGWTFTRTMGAERGVDLAQTLKAAIDPGHGIPFAVTRLDFNHGDEGLRRVCFNWAESHGIEVSRLRPIMSSEALASKAHHMVHRYGFGLPYRTAQECRLLNRLWQLVNDRLNFLTPTKKPVGWSVSRTGRKKRVYDVPAAPVDRLLAAGVISPAQEAELCAYRRELNPAHMSREITDIQRKLRANDTTMARRYEARALSCFFDQGL